MTIPVLPGPFSFLESAGEAVGAVGGALEQKRQRLDAEARARLTNILSLIEQGAEPSTFSESGGAALERLGLAPVGQGQRVLRGPAERARLVLDKARTELRRSEAETTTAEAGAAVAPRVAGAGATRAEAEASTATTEAAAAESFLPVRQRINQLITEELKKPESDFAKLAARAAAGTLTHYNALMQVQFGDRALERERQRERFELLFLPLSSAETVLKERQDAWVQQRTNALLGREDDKELVEQWETDHPKPTLQAVQQELMENAARRRGLNVTQYDRLLNETVRLLERIDEIALPKQKLTTLQGYVNEVLSGARTPEDVIKHMTVRYRQSGRPDAELMIQLDVTQFHRLLEEAQRTKK